MAGNTAHQFWLINRRAADSLGTACSCNWALQAAYTHNCFLHSTADPTCCSKPPETPSLPRHIQRPHSTRSDTDAPLFKAPCQRSYSHCSITQVSHARWPAAPAAACSSHPATAAGWPQLLPAQPSSNGHSKLSGKSLPVTRAVLYDAHARQEAGPVTAAHQPTRLFFSRKRAAACPKTSVTLRTADNSTAVAAHAACLPVCWLPGAVHLPAASALLSCCPHPRRRQQQHQQGPHPAGNNATAHSDTSVMPIQHLPPLPASNGAKGGVGCVWQGARHAAA